MDFLPSLIASGFFLSFIIAHSFLFFCFTFPFYHYLITSELPQVYDTSVIIISVPGSN